MDLTRTHTMDRVRQEIDTQNMWKAIAGFHKQFSEAASLQLPEFSQIDTSRITNIVFCGMGGSAIGGDLLSAYFHNTLRVPLQVVRQYRLPAYVDKNTLVFASSYSGNTEETLATFHEAKSKNAQIIGITSGGTLMRELSDNHLPGIKIPGGLQPRAALGYSFVPLARTIAGLRLGDQLVEDHIRRTVDLLREKSDLYKTPGDQNEAYSLARAFVDTIPVIYTAPELSVIGTRWKGQIAENAQMLSFTNALPEMNHNEIVGWDRQPDFLKRISLVWLSDSESHPQVVKRVQITNDLIKQYAKGFHLLSTEGESWMERLFSLIHLGDWISLYLALIQQVDPTPVERINQLKSALSS